MTMSRHIGVRLSPEQYEELERIARARGINQVSTLVRSILVETLHLPTNGSESSETEETASDEKVAV